MILPLALFTRLALACAPSVHVDTLAAIARTESGFDPYTLHDNTTGRSFKPRTAAEALALATALSRRGHSLDLGLMQVNGANLAALGMSVEAAFDPCRNLAAGARVLVEGFEPPPEGQDAQPRLLKALSRYNTGHPERGFQNGYVNRVQAAAETIVPAIRLRRAAVPESAATAAVPPAAPPSPPSWDVYAQARWARAATTPPGRLEAANTPGRTMKRREGP